MRKALLNEITITKKGKMKSTAKCQDQHKMLTVLHDFFFEDGSALA